MKVLLKERVKEVRELRGFSQKKLAEKVGVSREYMNMIESGERLPSVITLMRLARALECSIDYLVGMTHELLADGPAGYEKLSASRRELIRDLTNMILAREEKRPGRSKSEEQKVRKDDIKVYW